MEMIINGVDFAPYIAQKGLNWKYSAIDGPNAGRLSEGSMQRDLVAEKIRFDLTMRPLDSQELSKVLSAVRGEFYPVTYTDPMTNKRMEGTFYSNNYSVNLYGVVQNGKEVFTGLVLPVIQR